MWAGSPVWSEPRAFGLFSSGMQDSERLLDVADDSGVVCRKEDK